MEGSAWVHDAKLSFSHRAPLSCVDWTNKKPETLLWHRRTVNQVKDRTVLRCQISLLYIRASSLCLTRPSATSRIMTTHPRPILAIF